MDEVKKADPHCENCWGEGELEEAESFQNAYGEHGLENWSCYCTERKKKASPRAKESKDG